MIENAPPGNGEGLSGSDTAKALNHRSPCRSHHHEKSAPRQVIASAALVKINSSADTEILGRLDQEARHG